MKTTKKLFSILLTIALIVTILPMGVFTVSAETEGYYTYEVLNDEATITGCDTSISGDITIPSTLGGYPVTSIGNFAFEYCSNLASITIPDSVASIGNEAFYGCKSLTNITIPDSVTSIGIRAFSRCSNLTSITIPNSITRIEVNAFAYCSSLASIKIPDSVTSIGNYAFYECISLTSITIPDKVTSIGDSAFFSCESLTSITIPDSVTSIGGWAFYCCYNLTRVAIGNSVTSIGSWAFYGCESLTSINIPDSVTSIEDYAFGDCYALSDVYYSGTEKQWKNIVIGEENDYLLNANIHYNYTGNEAVTGDTNDDGEINVLDAISLRNGIIGKEAHSERADMNGDLVFDIYDLLILKAMIFNNEL